MDSGFKDKQNRVLVMSRKRLLHVYIVYLTFVELQPILLSCMNCFILLC